MDYVSLIVLAAAILFGGPIMAIIALARTASLRPERRWSCTA